MKKALITGVAGFIGSHLAAELLQQGWSVTGLDSRSATSDPVAGENLAVLAGDPRFQFVRADVTAGDLMILSEGVHAVFHLAALAGVRRSWGDRFGDYLSCNVLGTQRLLEACAAADVPRLVFASSSSVYGQVGVKPSREDDQPLPLSPYGVSKLAAERLCLAYASQRHVATSVIALRYFSVYGPRQRPDMAFSRIMRAAAAGRAMSFYGTGAQRRDFTYVTDAVAATIAATIAAATADARAEVVNVASGRSVPLTEARRAISQFVGTDVPAQRRVAQPGDVEATTADLTKATELLGYQPKVDLEEGLLRQWEWIAGKDLPAALAMPEAVR